MSDNNDMLRAANLAARALVLVAAGVLSFVGHEANTAILAVKIAVFALSTVIIIGSMAWRSAGVGARYAPLLPCALGFVVVACGVAGSGGWLITLSCIAAVQVGGDLGLVTGWIVVGLGMVATGVTGLVTSTPETAATDTVLVFVFFLIGLNRRDHRIRAEQTAAMLAQADQLREEQTRAAALEERARIAREIHDVLAHSLGALGVQIQFVRAVLTDQHDEARAVELLDQAHRMATDGLTETRRAVHALRGQTPWLPEGLAELGADHQRRHGARVSFAVTGEPRPLQPAAGLAMTRTAQEALVNTAKHAPREPVEMCLDYADAGTSLTVRNHLASGGGTGLGGDGTTSSGGRGSGGAAAGGDGGGPGLATVNGGYGLAGMRERLQLLGGSLNAGRADGDWVVVAQVPR
jgi:signal transduction histidine kinase